MVPLTHNADHMPYGTPQLLDHRGQPISSADAKDGKARAGGIALPSGMAFIASTYGGSHSFWIDRWDEAMRHGRSDAVDMEHDCYLMALLEERKEGTHGLPWHIEVPDEKEKEQVRVKDGLTKLLKDIALLDEMIWWWLDAIWYGRHAVQVEWDWVEFEDREPEGFDDEDGEKQDGGNPLAAMMQARRRGRPDHYGMAMPPGMPGGGAGAGVGTARPKPKPKPKGKTRRGLTVKEAWPFSGDKIGHLEDGTPYLLVNPARQSEIPNAEFCSTTVGGTGLLLRGSWRERFIIHQHEVQDRDFFLGFDQQEAIHGVGIRSQIFWPNWLRLEALSKVVDYFSRVGMGLTVWYYDAGNPASRQVMEQVAREQTDRTNLFVPRFGDGKDTGNAVERVEVPTSGAEAVMKLVEYHDKSIERYIVGQEGSASATSASGHSNESSSDFQAATKAAKVRTDARRLGATITGTDRSPGLISMMQRYTYPETRGKFQARFVFDLEAKESQEKLQAVKTLVDMGVKVKADDARAAAGVSKPADGDEVVEPPQPPGGAGGAPGGADPMAALMGGAGGSPGAAQPGQEQPADASEGEGDFLDVMRQARDLAASLRHARHRHASTHVLLPDDLARAARRLSALVKDAHLAADGREDEPHVTVKHGLAPGPDGAGADAVRRVVASFGPVRIRLGKLGCFLDGESGTGDVLHVQVDSSDLRRLNALLERELPHVRTHPFYTPHATLAYLRPGLGKRYAALPCPLEGVECTLDSLVYSDADGVKTTIPLVTQRDPRTLEPVTVGPAVEETSRPTEAPAPQPSSPDVALVVRHLRRQGRADLARNVVIAYARRLEEAEQYRRVPSGTPGAVVKRHSQVDFDESKHPRDHHGKFATSEGGRAAAKELHEKLERPHPANYHSLTKLQKESHYRGMERWRAAGSMRAAAHGELPGVPDLPEKGASPEVLRRAFEDVAETLANVHGAGERLAGEHGRAAAGMHPRGFDLHAHAAEAHQQRAAELGTRLGEIAARIASAHPASAPQALSADNLKKAQVFRLSWAPGPAQPAARVLIGMLQGSDALATGGNRVVFLSGGKAEKQAVDLLASLGVERHSLGSDPESLWDASRAPVQARYHEVPESLRGHTVEVDPDEKDVDDLDTYKRISRNLYVQQKAEGGFGLVTKDQVPGNLTGVGSSRYARFQDEDLEDGPEQYRRVPEGTPGAVAKKDSLGRAYHDLPSNAPAAVPEATRAEAPPKAPKAPPPAEPVTNPAPTRPDPKQQRPAAAAEPATRLPGSPASRSSLARSPVSRHHKLGGGCNQTFLLELEDGSQGVFKPEEGEEPYIRRGVSAGTYWRREVAVSEVADVLGFGDLVPTTTARKQDGKVGSIQAFVDDSRDAADVPAAERYDGGEDASRAALLDYVVGHLDRHEGNWRLTAGGKVALIDNGLSLPHSYHESDFYNTRFLNHALDWPLPDTSALRGKWPAVEQALRKNGVEDRAIALTRQRFDAAVGAGKRITFADLPSPLREGETLRQMVPRKAVELAALKEKMRKQEEALAERERREREELAQVGTQRFARKRTG